MSSDALEPLPSHGLALLGQVPADIPVSADTWRAMFDAATRVRLHAWAPYSRFLVGAAMLDEKGLIHVACNVENAAYPQGVCAEAGALSAMISAGGRRLRAALVVGDGDDLVTPCGGCRQRLREFGGPTLPIVVAGLQGPRALFTLNQLLPVSFGPHHLGQA